MKDNEGRDRPYVVMQMAASIDGRIAMAPGLSMFDKHPAEALLPDGGPIWKKVEQAIEAAWHPAATMLGSGSVQRESEPMRELPRPEADPGSLYEDFLPEEVVQNTKNWAVLVDGRGRCRGGYKATEHAGCHILHLVSRAAPAEYLAFLRRERIPYFCDGKNHADLETALQKLHAKLGVHSLRLIGGGTLNGAMLRARLIDEIHLIVWPVLLGGNLTPTLADCADLTAGELPAKLRLVAANPQADGHVWLHYQVEHQDLASRAQAGPFVMPD